MRWEKRDVEAGSDEAEDEAGCRGEMDRSRAVALRVDNCGILIGWRVVEDDEDLSLYVAC